MLYIFLFLLPLSVFPLPQDGKVVHGCISIEQSKNQMQITQRCEKAIIDWKDFSLNEGEIVKVIQKDNFSVLNRVVTDKISKIYGSIEATGKFYLINQNGILIGPNGSINAKEVLFSTLELSKEEYLKGHDLKFSSIKNGKIENFGSIKAVNSDVFILSKNIENKGKILAKKGEVNLIAAADVLILDDKNDIIIKPEVDGSITNEGNIKAIEVKLKSSNNIDSFAINQKGLIEATGFEKKDGKVILKAEKGICQSEGKIIATNENGTGGRVHLLADHVNLINDAKIDVSAKMGEGEILIGGDYQGKNSNIKNAKTVFVSKDANISADAKENGNGGKVILWADETNHFYGDISAKGGEIKGDGGFVEVSADNFLDFKGKVRCSAVNGKNGTLLLDPSDIEITAAASSPAFVPPTYNPGPGEPLPSNLNVTDLTTALAGTNVSILTSNGTSGVGDIDVLTSISWIGTGTLTMLTVGKITIDLLSTISWTGGTAGTTMLSMTSTADRVEVKAGSSITFSSDTKLFISAKDRATIKGNITSSFAGVPITPFAIEIIGDGSAPGFGDGIRVDAAAISSVNGNIKLTGLGSDGGGDVGIELRNAGMIVSSGSGANAATITLTGTGGSVGSANYGVFLDGATADISSSDGNISITGESEGPLNTNYGVFLNGAKIDSTGVGVTAATITVNGIGGQKTGVAGATSANNYGVYITGVAGNISSSGGDVTITGSSNGRDIDNDGINISGGGKVLVNANSNLVLTGTGGGDATVGTSSENHGIKIDGLTAFIRATNGSISITGTGGPSSLGLGEGIELEGGGQIISQGSANITIVGTGAATGGGNNNHGFIIERNLAGTDSGNVEVEGSGNITITGTATLGNSDGCRFEGRTSGTTDYYIRTTTGTVQITGTGSGTSNGINIENANFTVGGPAQTGNITLISDTMNFAGPIEVLSTGTLIIKPKTNATTMGLGNASVGTLNLTQADLIQIQDGFSLITFGVSGAVTTGAVDVRAFTYLDPIEIIGSGITVNGALNTSGTETMTLQSDTISVLAPIGNAGGASILNLKPLTVSTNIGLFSGTGAYNLTTAAIAFLNGNLSTVNIGLQTTGTGAVDIGTGASTSFNDFDVNIFGNSVNLDDDLTMQTTRNIAFTIGQAVLGTGIFTFNNFITVSGGGTATINGTAGSNDIVQGPNLVTPWTIATADDAGTITPAGGSLVSFNEIQKLIGGTAADTFTFSGAFQITGIAGIGIDGGGGAGENTVVGPNIINAWAITADDIGNITPTGATGATNFQNIQNVTGGTAADTFTFNGAFQLAGTTGINGNTGGSNEIVAPNVVNTWTVSGMNLGNLSPSGATGATNFQNIQTLTGNAATDTFNITYTAGQTIAVNGSGGANKLVGPNAANVWTITGNDDAGTLQVAGSGLISFSNIDQLEGEAAVDQFMIGGAFRITGSPGIDGKGGTNTITGADGMTNEWHITANNAGTIDPGGAGTTSFINIVNLQGGDDIDNFRFDGNFRLTGATGIDGKAGVNTIFGPNIAGTTTWNITTADSGTINPGVGTTNFTETGGGTVSLTGGTGADLFDFSNGATLSGKIDGGSGGSNTIDTASYLAPDTLTLSVDGGVGIITGGFDNIETIIGGAATETLIARNTINAWTISANDGGNVTNGSDNINFTNINVLQGVSGNDTFTFTSSVSISGGLVGSGGTNTIVATTGVNNTWAIIDDDTGTITPLADGTTSFATIQNLTGGNSNDNFVLSDGKGMSGLIKGGSSCAESNVLDYSAYDTSITVTVTGLCPAVGIGTATNILGGIQFITLVVPPGGFPPPPLPPVPQRDTNLEKAYISETMVTYDLKDFVEFNDYLKRYKLIYLNNSIIGKEDKKQFLQPEYEYEVFKDLKKD